MAWVVVSRYDDGDGAGEHERGDDGGGDGGDLLQLVAGH